MRDEDKSIVEHLSEFRKRFIYILIFYVLIFCISLIYSDDIYILLTKSFSDKLVVLGPNDILAIYIKIASISAFSFTLPFICYQIWLFILPALNEGENRTIIVYIPAIFILFILGLSFGFFIIVPTLLNVLISIGDNLFSVQLTARSYLDFVFDTSLPIAVIFEMPVIAAFLTTINIVTPNFLISNRRYSYFILLVLAVILTPADLISDISMTIPLIFIYEISILVSKRIYNKKKRG